MKRCDDWQRVILKWISCKLIQEEITRYWGKPFPVMPSPWYHNS